MLLWPQFLVAEMDADLALPSAPVITYDAGTVLSGMQSGGLDVKGKQEAVKFERTLALAFSSACDTILNNSTAMAMLRVRPSHLVCC